MKFFPLTFTLLLSLNIVNAERFYVSTTASEGGDGVSWTSAFNFLQDGLDETVVGRGDQV